MSHDAHQKCAYCSEPATTRDHIPPKNLFAKPRPSTLITVPACAKHNNDASLDDEYFRAMISFRLDVYEHAEGTMAATRTLDRMSRAESEGFLRAFASTIKQEPLYSRAGVYLGTAPTYEVQTSRIMAVVERIVRGLYFHHMKVRLPPDSVVTIYPLELLTKPDLATFRRFASLITWTGEAPRNVTARNVLEYKFRATPDGNATGWMLRFYEAVPFLAITTNPRKST